MSGAGEIHERPPGQPAAAVPRAARILIADEDAVIRDIVSRKLTGQGYECECCSGEKSALELLSAKQFDLVLTGFLGTAGGSNAVVSEMKQASPDTAVVLLTSVIDIGLAVSLLKDGAYDYITKPCSPDEMSIRVSRALEKRRLLRENEDYQRSLKDQVAQRARQLKEALGVLEQTYHSTLVALSKALDSRDADPENYSVRVTARAARVARRLGLSKPETRALENGVLLHDIGKIGIPDELLHKTGPLSAEEQLLVHKHPVIGHNILSTIKFLRDSAPLVLHHHERYDGQGYPQNLKGDEIHLGARIFAFAEALEALISPPPSGRALSFGEARREIEKMSGAWLDPVIVRKLTDLPLLEWEEMCREVDVHGKSAGFLRRDPESVSRIR